MPDINKTADKMIVSLFSNDFTDFERKCLAEFESNPTQEILDKCLSVYANGLMAQGELVLYQAIEITDTDANTPSLRRKTKEFRNAFVKRLKLYTRNRHQNFINKLRSVVDSENQQGISIV